MIFNFNSFSLLENYGVPNFAKKLSSMIISDLFKNKFTSYKLQIEIKEIENIKNIDIIISHIRQDFSSSFRCDASDPFNTMKMEFDVPFNIEENYEYLYELILHELTHLYEFYRIYINGKKLPIYNSIKRGLINTIQQDNIDPFNYFRYIVYLTLDNELNARVSQTYIYLKRLKINDEKIILNALEKSSTWNKMSLISKFDYKKYSKDIINIIGVDFACILINEFNKELINNSLKFSFLKFVNNESDIYSYFKSWSIRFVYKIKKHKLKLLKLAKEIIKEENE